MANPQQGHTMSDAHTQSIRFAYGSNTFDSNPQQAMVESFEAFCRWIRANKVPATGQDAKGRAYICAPCAVAPDDDWHRQGTMVDSIGKEHRCKACSLPRQWLGFDIDKGLDADWIDGLRYGLDGIDCLIYTTASHTSDAPRVRIVVLLTRPVTRAEGVQASVALRTMIDARLGFVGYAVPTWDRAADRGEQPLFLPPADSTFIRLRGDPANADALIANSLAAGLVITEDAETRRVLRRVDGEVELQATPGALTYLRMLCDRVRAAPIGERNAALYAAAADAAKMDRLSDDLIGLELEQAALDAGMELSEIGKTIRSGVGHGRTQEAVPAVEDEFSVIEEELPPGVELGDAWPQMPETGTPEPDTDLANALRLCKAHGVDLLFSPGVGWHVWQPFGPWSRSELGARLRAGRVGDIVRAEAIRMLQAMSAAPEEQQENLRARATALLKWLKACGQSKTISNALAEAAPMLALDANSLDNNPWLLGCPNGALDLKTGVLRKYRRDDFITQTCSTVYDRDAKAPRWGRFIGQIFKGDQQLIRRVQEWCGYVLTGLTIEHMLFIAYGSGSNGKSTFVDALCHMMGGYAKAAAPGLLMARNGEQHPTELHDMRGARLMTSSETGESGRLNEERVKALSGGDKVKGRAMGKDFIEFASTAKLLICTNHKPIVSGQDLGLWRRMWLVPFTATFTGAAADKGLPAALREEAAGILNWALEGLARWRLSGFSQCDAIEQASREYKAESDTMGTFLSECCTIEAQAFVTSAALYAEYKAWAVRSGIRYPHTATLFGRKLDERGLTKENRWDATAKKSAWVWVGVKLHSEWGG